MDIEVLVRDELAEARAYGVLIPVTVRQTTDGKTYVICYPEVEDAVRAVLAEGGEPLLADTISKLIVACTPFAKQYGYTPEPYDIHYQYVVYEMDAPQMPVMAANVEVRQITEEDFTKFPTATDFLPYFPNQRMVGVFEDGSIVSVAAENPYAPEGTAELQVTTGEAYRGKGYAAAAVSLLTRILFADGIDYICYHAPSDNAASIHVAEVAGFTRAAEYYPILCYIS